MFKEVDDFLHLFEVNATRRTASSDEGLLDASCRMNLLSVTSDIDALDSEVPSKSMKVTELPTIIRRRGLSVGESWGIMRAGFRKDGRSVPKVKMALGNRSCHTIAVKWREHGTLSSAPPKHCPDRVPIARTV